MDFLKKLQACGAYSSAVFLKNFTKGICQRRNAFLNNLLREDDTYWDLAT